MLTISTSRSSRDLRVRAAGAQRVARNLAEICLTTWATLDRSDPATARIADAMLDCAHIASTTGRLLEATDDQHMPTVAMLATICRRFAARCLDLGASLGSSQLAAFEQTAKLAIRAFDDLVASVFDGTQGATDDDVTVEMIALTAEIDDAVA